MVKQVLICIAVYTLCAGDAAATIIPPIIVKGTNARTGATTDPDIACKAVLLSHGKVEFELTLKGPLLDPDWVLIHLRDGTEDVILSAALEGRKSEDGQNRVFRATIARTAIKNSYLTISGHTKGEKPHSRVLMDSIEIFDDWTDKMHPKNWSEEHVLGTFGPPDYDSRKTPGNDKDGSYLLKWNYGKGRDFSIQMRDEKVVDYSHPLDPNKQPQPSK